MRLIKSTIFIAGILFSSGVQGMATSAHADAVNKIAVSFDLDEVVSTAFDVDKGKNILDCMDRVEFMDKLSANYKEAVLKWSNNQFDECESVKIQYPIMPLVKIIRKLKKRGYTVIGATNQSSIYHRKEYRSIMRCYGIDFNDLFHAVLTTRSSEEILQADSQSNSKLYCRVNTSDASDNIYSMFYKGHKKPDQKYFESVEHLVKKINPYVTKIVHIDDKSRNRDGAQKAGLQAIKFDSSRKKRSSAIDNLKDELIAHGVSFDKIRN